MSLKNKEYKISNFNDFLSLKPEEFNVCVEEVFNTVKESYSFYRGLSPEAKKWFTLNHITWKDDGKKNIVLTIIEQDDTNVSKSIKINMLQNKELITKLFNDSWVGLSEEEKDKLYDEVAEMGGA